MRGGSRPRRLRRLRGNFTWGGFDGTPGSVEDFDFPDFDGFL